MYIFDGVKFAKTLKNEIKKAGFTQSEFAERTGIPLSTLRTYMDEKSTTEPKATYLYRIADALKIPIENLLNSKKTKIKKSITPVDIISAINLLIDAYGEHIVSEHFIKEWHQTANGYPDELISQDGYAIKINDAKIQNYINNIKNKGQIKYELQKIDASDKYDELLENWADIDNCIFENGHIYNPSTQELKFNKNTFEWDVEEKFEEILDDDLPF